MSEKTKATRSDLRYLRSVGTAQHPWRATSRADGTILLRIPRTGPGLRGRHGVLTRLGLAGMVERLLNGGGKEASR